MKDLEGYPWLYKVSTLTIWPRHTHRHKHTFEVKEHIRSVVLEHLSNEFDVHILDIDILWYLALAPI